MPTFDSGDIVGEFPTTELERLVEGVQETSVLASLSPERPTLFGNVSSVTMTEKPRAQIVAEGAQKASSTAGWASVTTQPIKIQTTIRMTEEVRWIDEDHRVGIVDELTDALTGSMTRAVDLIGLHGVNPLTGERAASIADGAFLDSTTNRVTASDDPTADIEAAIGAIVGGGFLPNGLGLDVAYAFQLATQRDANSQLVNPGLGYGQTMGNYNGLNVARSSTVSGLPEIADGSGNLAFVGDWSKVRWGFQRRIPVELIEYGDPDGQGRDLKGTNEIAYRAEAVLYVAVLDLAGFSVIETAPVAG